MAQERLDMTQLVTTISWHEPYWSDSRRFFRQMQSSPEVIWQLLMRTRFE